MTARTGLTALALALAASTMRAQDQAPADTARVNEGYPSVSPDGRFLLYVSDRDGDYEIVRRHLATGHSDTLTRNSAFDYTPVWSPDGAFILFVSDRDGATDVWEMRSDGSNPQPLTRSADEEEHPRYSADGRRIILAVTPASDTSSRVIALLERRGGTPRAITSAGAVASYPSFNPDGTAIVYRRRQPGAARSWDLVVRILSTGKEHVVAPHPANDDYPVWSPDGAWIAFASDRDGAGDPGFDLYLISPDGRALRRLTCGRGAPVSYYRPSFSPDGLHLWANRRSGRRLEAVRLSR